MKKKFSRNIIDIKKPVRSSLWQSLILIFSKISLIYMGMIVGIIY
ncbi:MAG: hypothetical protein RBT69_05525 [Spirochaetia bacterium]|nr:hypothetical protein [Spirochaetia bacterium]